CRCKPGMPIELCGYNPLAFAAAYSVISATTILFGLVCGHLIDQFGALIVPVWGAAKTGYGT
ncbi:MAG: hypothetical protein E5W91_33010, partial [Mesorhizobium sp.]